MSEFKFKKYDFVRFEKNSIGIIEDTDEEMLGEYVNQIEGHQYTVYRVRGSRIISWAAWHEEHKMRKLKYQNKARAKRMIAEFEGHNKRESRVILEYTNPCVKT